MGLGENVVHVMAFVLPLSAHEAAEHSASEGPEAPAPDKGGN